MNAKGVAVVQWGLELGQPLPRALPIPDAGAPRCAHTGTHLTIEGDDFAFAMDASSGTLHALDGARAFPVQELPILHLTAVEGKKVFDFAAMAPPYCEFPDAATRTIEEVTTEVQGDALTITVHDRFADFAGRTQWRLDRAGMGIVSYDYAYSGPPREIRELGVKLLMDSSCQRLSWERRGLWGIYPEDHIGRPSGEALAYRPSAATAETGPRPDWPWLLDENDLGANDFRSTRFGIYRAGLTSTSGAGICALADADVSVRACLTPRGTMFHLFENKRPLTLGTGDKIQGAFHIRLAGGKP
jgi:hypothetical protein